MHGNDVGRLRGLAWTSRLSPATHMVAIGALLALAWGVVYATGGTHTAWPHLFYFPIVLAALALGLRSAVVAGVLATIASGPLMPLNTAGAGVDQSLENWLTRGAFFVAIGIFTGATIDSLRAGIQRSITEHIDRELESVIDPVPAVSAQMAARIREAITHRRFHPVYQPIYALDDGRLLAVEALTRFDGPPDQPPDVWFDQATRTGMEVELDLATAQAALDGADEHLPAGVALHVNVTPATLRDTRLLALLGAYPHHQLVIEITEHAVIDDYPRLAAACQRLRDNDIQIAVDDTGAGISSLRHVIKLAPEIIKLDISLTRNVRDDPIQHALAHAITRFTSEIDALLVVEGIEEQPDLTAWSKLGAHAAQGYYLARPGPLPASDHCPLIPGPRALDRRAGTDRRHPLNVTPQDAGA